MLDKLCETTGCIIHVISECEADLWSVEAGILNNISNENSRGFRTNGLRLGNYFPWKMVSSVAVKMMMVRTLT